MEEIWKDIKGYEGIYKVSNLGRIKSLPRKINNQYSGKETILKQFKTIRGYYTVALNGKRKFVHRIVAETFISNDFQKRTVNHIDGNKINNNIHNLEWLSYSENLKHAYKNGLKIATSNHLKKKINQYDINKKFIKEWESTKEIERKLGICHGAISACCKHKKHYNTAGGYIWEYSKN